MSEFGYNYTQMGTIIPGGSSIIKAQGQRCRWETFFLNLMKWGLEQKKTIFDILKA